MPEARILPALTLSLLLATTACQSTFGTQGRVAIGDPAARAHLQADPTMTDYMAFAEQVTNKMLTSPVVQSWGEKRPKLIVGRLQNNTDNENIRIRDIQDRIQEVLFNSGLVRVVDSSATSFDYIIKSELSSTRQYGDRGEELAHFTLQLKLFAIDGELLGQWSDDLPLAKARRTLF